jgi:hypothetical protein
MMLVRCLKCNWEQPPQSPRMHANAVCPTCGEEFEPNPEQTAVTIWEPTDEITPRWWHQRRMEAAGDVSYMGPVLFVGKQKQTYTVPWVAEIYQEWFLGQTSPGLNEGGQARLILPNARTALVIEDCGAPGPCAGQILPMLIHTKHRLFVTNLPVIWEAT